MIVIPWLKGVFTHRWGRLSGAICGVAMSIALLASLSSFIVYSGASLTKRAIGDIPVDWQVQIVPGTDVQSVQAAIGKTTSYTALEEVSYADTAGFETTSDSTVQTTGPGKVLGISDNYHNQFPEEIRLLIGTAPGVLVAQQTAANLHVQIGDVVTIMRVGLPPVKVKVDGIVDLPNADSLFQIIGLPSGAAPQAPPDNVVLLPDEQWHQIFDAQTSARPDSVRMQLHVRIDHSFNADPNIAYAYVQHKKNNLEASIAGSGIVGDNIAARLAAVREDAFYAKVLFLFLGFPGAVLAVLLTFFIAASGAKHRRQEQALLRIHGASARQVLSLAALEALAVGLGGVVLGVIFAYFTDRLIIPGGIRMDTATLFWTVISAITGLIIALVSILYPAWKQAHHSSVVAVEKSVMKRTEPIWQRFYFCNGSP